MTNSYFTDPRDGETYRIVKIGNRIWFAENLRHKCEGAQAYVGGMGYLCLNGETPPYDWSCDPDVKKYGLCYYWKFAEAAVPEGWRLPNNDDWRDLFDAVGAKCEKDEHGAETYLGAALALKSKDGWEEDELFPVVKVPMLSVLRRIRQAAWRNSAFAEHVADTRVSGVPSGKTSGLTAFAWTTSMMMPFSTAFGMTSPAQTQSGA